jgi:thiamine-phosphate diphosphorylase
MELRGLYVITDRQLARGRTHEDVVAAALRGGARIIQLRDKDCPRAELVAVGRRLAALCREANALFIVNDDPEVAAEAGAGGVHLGPSDMAPAEARRILGPDAVIGWSIKASLDMARQAEALGVSYVAVGSIFATSTKTGAIEVGLAPVGQVRAATGLPVAAIGGITAANVGEVVQAGAEMACVIGAAVAAPDVEVACREISRIMIER